MSRVPLPQPSAGQGERACVRPPLILPQLAERRPYAPLCPGTQHARRTSAPAAPQATAFSQLNKAVMGVWEALELLNTLREYETALLGPGDDALLGAAPEPPAPDMPLLEHALQCAEACRAAFPEEDFMHLAGLLAPLGKLLAHAKWVARAARGGQGGPGRVALHPCTPCACPRMPWPSDFALCLRPRFAPPDARLPAPPPSPLSPTSAHPQVWRGAAVGHLWGDLPGGLPLPPLGASLPILLRQPRPPQAALLLAHRGVPRRLRSGRRAHVLGRRRVPPPGAAPQPRAAAARGALLHQVRRAGSAAHAAQGCTRVAARAAGAAAALSAVCSSSILGMAEALIGGAGEGHRVPAVPSTCG